MPRSSKHKSHKQSKHSPKEGRDYSYSDSDSEVKMKEKEKEKEKEEEREKERERSSKEDSLARVTKDLIHSGSGEKRKHSSQSKEGKEGKDITGYGNGDASEDYVSSKRRKEKAEAGSGGADRWNGAADSAMKGESLKIDGDKGSKGKETKSSSDSKSKNSKKEGSLGSLVEKEESKSGRVESKRKSEKDYARKEGKDSKEVKEKERGSDREKKSYESKRDEVDIVKKQGSQSGDVSEEKQNKKGREIAECSIQNEVPNLDVDKEAERRARKRREVSGDRGKFEDDINESDDRRLSSRAERTRDEKRLEKYKEYKEDGDKEDRHKDDRYREDVDKDRKRRDDKYREDSDRNRDNRRRDDKYLEDVDRDSRRRDDKYRDDGDRDNRRKDDRYREDDIERDSRRRDDKYREDVENDNRHRDDKYREYGEKDGRHDEDRYHEDGERDDRQRDIKYREDSERDKRRKDEKHRDDFERHGRCKDGVEADESDKKRRLNDAKYGDERAPRDHSGDRSDAKRSRDEGHVSDLYLRKSGMHEGNPSYDRTRYKDEPGRRRTLDKEDLGDIRSRSSKDQRSDSEKRVISSARAESITDRGRSTSRNADVEITPKKSRWKTSPNAGPHTTRDNYRLSKQEESKYRDYPYDERVRHGGTSRDYAGSGASIERISSSRSTDKIMQKEDIFLGEFSAERRLKSDVRSSPLQLVDRSPSSASNERRHLTRSEVRRSLDVEDSAQRSGGSREVKEGRGNRDFAGDAFAGDEPSQMDGDNVSVSSPFIRGIHLSGSLKSALPPPPPFRSGVDSPSMFGSLEDDSRGKSTNRHRRINDPTIGRMQGNAWKGVPNWPSPLANGFMPFQHGPPPVGFHPAMQQFPGPPIFGVRPSMDLSHPGVPYHMPDADRFSGHGRPMGWRTPLDDSCGPPLHGWDANNFGEEAHLYGRPDWDQARTLSNNSRSWETIGDVWKGSIRGTSVELPSGSQKEVCSIQGPDNFFAAQSAQQAQSEQKQSDQGAESNDISQSSSVPGRSTLEDLKINHEEQPIEAKSSRKEETPFCAIYLRKLHISPDLTEPELFDQCTKLMGVEQDLASDVNSSKILFLEGTAESNVTLPSKFSSAADSVFQKAFALYKKGREENKFAYGPNFSFSGQLGESYSAPKLENPSSVSAKVEESPLVDDGLAKDVDEGVDLPVSSKEIVGHPQTPMDLNPTETSDLPISMDEGAVGMEAAGAVVDVTQESKIALKSLSLEEVGQSYAPLAPLVSKDLIQTGISILNDVKEEEMSVDAKCGPVPHPDVSSEVFEAVMPESIESESVNLSRIHHHSPESTH
ncbi:trichohyalin isoform X1 [Capsicum annuum]|uniref:trichohyalin isoform X1 n=1 Tax=Capsicum annuum TaxID=4072 RepID=UPI001FB0E5C1|nr:trichohyalin isoform X1 [Capsicum annuum]